MKSLFKSYRYLLFVIAGSFFFFYCVLQVAIVPTDSMSPAVGKGSVVIGLRHMQPERGDIILFSKGEGTYIKRVVGKGGDTIELKQQGVYRNGEKMEEPYACGPTTPMGITWHIPENAFFVLGDNRTHSLDSRYWQEPYVKEAELKSRVFLVIAVPHQKGTSPLHVL